jgi:hypothetical protein
MARFSPEELAMARTMFTGEDKDHPPCPDCGGVHARSCPRVSSDRVVWSPTAVDAQNQPVAIEREVHYWPPGAWEEYVIFARDAFADDAAAGDEDPGPGGDGEGSRELVGPDRPS